MKKIIGLILIVCVSYILAQETQDGQGTATFSSIVVSDSLTVTGSTTVDALSVGHITLKTGKRIYSADGGTNTWIVIDNTTNIVLRLNGSNTIFNVDLAQE